jgi:hypothetical protein
VTCQGEIQIERTGFRIKSGMTIGVGSFLRPYPRWRKIIMTGEILKRYTEARIGERLHLFLQFPDLRESFQEIDRKDLAYPKVSPSLGEEHDEAKYSLPLLLLRGVYHRIIEIRILKHLLKCLKPI